MVMPTVSAEDNKLIMRYRALLEKNGGSMIHDMNDPEQRAFVKLMHNLCGNTEELFPGLHAMIGTPSGAAQASAAADDDEGGWTTEFGVAQVGAAPQTQLAIANGYGTVVNGFQTCNLSLLVTAPNGSFLAYGSNAGQTPLNTLPVQTGGNAQPFVNGQSGMMTYSYLPPGGGQGVSGTVNSAEALAVMDPVVTEPKRENGNTNPYNPNAICIGLGRPNDLTRCDYIYNEPTQDNPIGRLPLVGNVTFNYPIQTLQPGQNFLVDIYVIRTDNGGQSTRLDPTDMNNVYANFAISGDTKTLTWNLPMKANTVPPEPPQTYNPVVFSNIPWATEMVSYLTCNITVTLVNGSTTMPVTVTIQSTDAPDEDDLDGVTYIMPIEFVWHCLGEDSQVTMADGTMRTMRDIKAGDAVRTEGGKQAVVSVTHNGNHFQDVYVLETKSGKTLVASAEHIIFTAAGGVPACELASGARLITADGETELAAVRREPGNGRNLWNLSLGEAPQLDDRDPEVGRFFANGVLVGDARATRVLRYRRIHDIDWVKARVPKSFHRDVESTFQMRKGKKLRMR